MYLTLCDALACIPQGSSIHAISQARTLERVAISSSWGSSRPRDQTHISCIFCIDRQILYLLSHRSFPEYLEYVFIQGKRGNISSKPCLCYYDQGHHPILLRYKLSNGLSARRTWSAFLMNCICCSKTDFCDHCPCLQKKKQQKKTKNSFLSLKFGFIPRVKMSQN